MVHGFHETPGAVIDLTAFSGLIAPASLLSYAAEHGNDLHINFGGANQVILVDFVAHGATLDISDFVL